MRVVELHDALALPCAGLRWSWITVDERHVAAASGQCDGGEQPGRSGADDDRSHHFSI
jgi:hypothetical protein